MTKEQYEYWEEFRSKEGAPSGAEAKKIAKMYAEIFNRKYWLPCGCNRSRWQSWIDELNKHFLSIEKPTE